MFPILTLVVALASAPPDTMVVPLREVVVTGTRSADTTLRIPAAISVVRGKQLTDTRGNNLKDALVSVPGVFSQSRAGGQDVRITIRGFGARGNGERSNVGNLRGIRVITDGIPVTEPDGRTSLDLVDIGAADRVEVSRSNASTLYGNASGGVVHLRTALDFADPFVEFRSRGGSFGYHREQLVTGFALGEARGQFSLLNSTFEGWRDHSESNGAQAQLRLAIPVDERSHLGLLADGSSNLNRFPGALTPTESAADPEQADPTFVSRDERRRNRVGRFGLTFDREMTEKQDLALTAFVEPKVLQRSERGRFRDFTRYHVGGSAAWSGRHQVRDRLEARWSAGGDEAFQDGSILFYNLNPDGSRNTTVRANKREAANSAGLFAQSEFRWNDRWRLALATRYDAIGYISEDRMDPVLNATKRFERVTPKASLACTFDQHTVFAALGGGVEAPAFNEIDPPPTVVTGLNPFLDAMYSTSYELGAKGLVDQSLVPGPLSYDVALYWIDVRNDIIPFAGGAYFETAGHTRRQGVELGLRWTPIPRATLTGSLSVSDNEYVDYQTEVIPTDDGDYSGRKMAGVPEKIFAGGLEVRLPEGFEAGVNVEAVDGYFADDANTLPVQNHAVLGASLAWEGGFGAHTVRAFVSGQNLTDAEYSESAFINPVPNANPSLIRYLEPGVPQNWAAGLTVRFH